jgi:hypothetical protein
VIPILVSILAIIALFAVLILVPRMMLKRAVRKVVKQFRREGAISPETAKTAAELRLPQGGIFAGMGRFRDYRPYAVRLLGQAEIILGTEKGGLYLSEEKLEGSPVKKFARLE